MVPLFSSDDQDTSPLPIYEKFTTKFTVVSERENAFRFEWKVDKILVTKKKKKCWKSIESVNFNCGAVLRFAPSFPLSFAIIVVQLFPRKTF